MRVKPVGFEGRHTYLSDNMVKAKMKILETYLLIRLFYILTRKRVE